MVPKASVTTETRVSPFRWIAVLTNVCILTMFLLGCSSRQRGNEGLTVPRRASRSTRDSSFDWMDSSPHAPTFRVLDTESSLGPYARKAKTITLEDLVKMHGHPCDGLFTAACAMGVGTRKLFSDGVIDRTDLCCLTNNSPCYGDVAAYLSGGRIRFGTQKIDPSLKNVWILHRPSTKETLRVRLREGVFPAELSALEGRIKSGTYGRGDIRRCQKMQWRFARSLLQKPLGTWFEVELLPDFVWKPDAYEHLGPRGDVRFKNASGAEAATTIGGSAKNRKVVEG